MGVSAAAALSYALDEAALESAGQDLFLMRNECLGALVDKDADHL